MLSIQWSVDGTKSLCTLSHANLSQVFSLGLTAGPLIAASLKDAIGYGNMNAVVAGLCAVVAVLSYFCLT